MSVDKRPYKERSAQIKQAVIRRRKKIKLMAVEYKGGKCELCGYSKDISALEFHHTDPSQKDFNVGYKGNTRSWIKVRQEIDKCILVCANCHREIHTALQKANDEASNPKLQTARWRLP